MLDFNIKAIDGGVCAALGFSAGSTRAGIKASSQKDDLAIIFCDSGKPCTAAAVYTTNVVKGAPITVTQKNLADNTARAIVVNSGNANTCNSNGIEIAELMCELTAQSLNINKEDVIVASTGVIGQKLSPDLFRTHIPLLSKNLSNEPCASTAACKAIMTTDTKIKEFAFEFMLGGKICKIGGISKGSGMIYPNMATLLGFITTDVNISAKALKSALSATNLQSYSRVNVDGDTSTNDMVCVMASGLAGNSEIAEVNSAEYEVFYNALCAVMVNLARETARDGEGATKLIECVAKNAKSKKDAELISKSVISSSLVKAAVFAADANWGRILCAAGYSGAEFDPLKISVGIKSQNGEVSVCENGAGADYSEELAHKVLSADEVSIIIDLQEENSAQNTGAAWGCDLTYDYVKINAEYRT